ncbi:MAG TPA: condensation domain-containing protein, partial [Polyangia bacterium]|nr:condensation domain-containing protein [Polyangia bacterium]
MSLAQRRLWFLAQLPGASRAYHVSGALRIRGPLDSAALARGLEQIVDRHEALRTRFVTIDGEPNQVIDPPGRGIVLRTDDLGAAAAGEGGDALERLIEADVEAPFSLEDGPLVRARLVRMGAEEHVLVLVMHHIVSDGWSLGVMVNELSALYEAQVTGKPAPLPPLSVQYADYSAWQRAWLSGAELSKQVAFWTDALRGAPPVLALPTDRPRSAEQDYGGASINVGVDVALTRELRALAQRHGVTLYMALLGAWAVALAHLTGQDDLVIGTPTAGRAHAEIEGLIGFFVNTLALRLSVGRDVSVSDFLAHVKARVLAAQAHQDLPFEQVVEAVQPVRSLAYAPLFQTMFAWQNAPEGSLELPAVELSAVPIPAHAAQFDLTLELQETDDGIIGTLNYATALFEATTVARYFGYFRNVLAALAAG